MKMTLPASLEDVGHPTRPREDAPVGQPAFVRLGVVDNARAIGIVLVVAGHAPGLPGRVVDFIFAFHIPLFFFLSGLLVSERHLRSSLPARAASLARTLLVPYAFYFVVAYGFWLLAKRHGLRALEMEALPWWDPVAGFLRGNGDGLYVDVVLWFFPCLFVTALLHHALRKRCSAATTAVVTALVAAVFVATHDPSSPRWVWSADCALVGIAFFASGATVHEPLVRRRAMPYARTTRLAIALVATIACAVLSVALGRADLNNLVFGATPALYLVTAAIGIAAALAWASTVPVSRIAVWLSSNTLVVFPLHFLAFSVLTGIGVAVFGLDPSFRDTAFAAAGYTLVALLACYPAARLIRFAAPWALGHHRTDHRRDSR